MIPSAHYQGNWVTLLLFHRNTNYILLDFGVAIEENFPEVVIKSHEGIWVFSIPVSVQYRLCKHMVCKTQGVIVYVCNAIGFTLSLPVLHIFPQDEGAGIVFPSIKLSVDTSCDECVWRFWKRIQRYANESIFCFGPESCKVSTTSIPSRWTYLTLTLMLKMFPVWP